MKKVLVSLAISTVFAACSDSTTKTDVTKDSTGVGTTTTVDTTKITTIATDTAIHKMDTSVHKIDTMHIKHHK